MFHGTASLESLAETLDFGTLISFNSSALTAIRLLRPDIRCIDFGADMYLPWAYGGDRNVLRLFKATGVEVVDGAVG